MSEISRRGALARLALRFPIILSIVAGLLSGAWVQAQDRSSGWQPLGGPAGRISHLAASPDGADLYAVSSAAARRRDDQTQWQTGGREVRSDALYRSQDGGLTWQALTNDLPPAPITALYADTDGRRLFVGLQDVVQGCCGGLWGSLDRGATWTRIPLGRDGLTIQRIARSAGGRHLLVVATAADSNPASTLYRSTDDGRTWTARDVLLADQPPGDVLTDLIPASGDASLLFAATRNGRLYRSADAGDTWNLQPLAFDMGQAAAPVNVRLVISPDNGDALLLARSATSERPDRLDIERSEDGGRSWRRLAAGGLSSQTIVGALSALRNSVYLLDSDQGAFRSTDGGTTWQPLEGPLSAGQVAEFLPLPATFNLQPATRTPEPSADQTVLAATGYGIFLSRDGGALWQAYGSGLPFNSSIVGLLTDARRAGQIWAISDTRPGAGTPLPPLVLRSLDSGRTWLPAARGLPAGVATAWTLDPGALDTLMLATAETFARTTDAGLTWQVTRLEPGTHAVIAVAPTDSRVIYLGGRPALRSTDRGASWQAMPVALPGTAAQASDVTGLAVDAAQGEHLWAGYDGGVAESLDGGRSWRAAGLAGQKVRWLHFGPSGGFPLLAGVDGDGIYRLDAPAGVWAAAAQGLPAGSTLLALVADERAGGALWALRDGGGVYRSTDTGRSWSNGAATLADNLAQSAAPDFADAKAAEGALLVGTANAGIWTQRNNAVGAGLVPAPTAPPRSVAARIEVFWPHAGAPVNEARLANLGVRIFSERSLLQPPCAWSPRVTIWQAVDESPAELLGDAAQRTIDGAPFPYWVYDDIDVSRARDGEHKLYYFVQVEGVEAATGIWAHAADSRTSFPQQDVPSGLAVGPIDAVDARIQIVWPHDASGIERTPAEAPQANVAVMLFKHGTRLSVPVGWHSAGLTLYGAWNYEVGRPLSREPLVQVRTSGAITYPVWEFTNIPVDRATEPGNRVYLWVKADGIETYPSIWAHGVDARTAFPIPDEPIQGCIP